MILNYSGFITSICSLLLMFLLPLFLSTYDNILLALLRGTLYVVTPMILFSLFTIPLFIREKKLLILLVPWEIIYSMLKASLISYLYIRYMIGRGITVVYGPRIMKVK